MTSVLRYPYEALTDKTDYFQITIKEYTQTDSLTQSSSFANASNGTSPVALQNLAASSLKPQQLAEGGIIILPMPSNIEDTNSVSYDGDTLNGLAAAGVDAVGKVMNTTMGDTGNAINDFTKLIADVGSTAYNAGYDAVKKLDAGNLRNLATKALTAQAVNIFNANVSVNQILARSSGKILNPNMELLFNNVTLRTFRFSFKMTPRDESESMQVKSIIRTLKKNMSAKKVQESNLFLQTPNIFELEYKKGPKLHPFLHRFKQCALSDMSVNYTGENVYATYSDGTPVSIILNLTFKELVPVYEDDYDDSGFVSGQDTTYKDKPNDLATAMDYGVDGQGPNGVQRNVEGVGY